MFVHGSGFEETLVPQNKEENVSYQVYGQRWLVLLAFCAFTFCNALGFVQYAPILSMAAQYYDVSDSAVVWFSICYYVTYFLLAPFSILPLGIRLDYSLFLAAFLTACGQWIIYIAHQSYIIAMLGFVLIGVGQIFVLAAPAYISDKWFPMHERTLSTCLGSFLNLVGLNFSIFYASITFEELANQLDEIIKEIDFMNLLYSIMNTIAFIMCLLMIRNEPPTPPSLSAASGKMKIMKSFKRAFRNFESIMDLISISMFIGAAWAYMVVIAILLEPFGYTQKDIGYVSIVYCATGTFGGTLASLFVDYQIKLNIKPHYDPLIKGFITFGMLGILSKALFIKELSNVGSTAIIIMSGCVGFGLNSFLPLAIQCYIEKMYPCFELVLTTVMMQMSNLLGFILNYVLALDKLPLNGLWILLIILGPFYVYLILFYKTKFRRFEMEQVQLT